MSRRVFASIVLTICTVLFVGMSRVAEADDRPPPSVDYQAQVVETFKSSAGGDVLYRRGWWYTERSNEGFGFDKVYHKHNIEDNQIVDAVVRNPGTTEDVGGGRWVHTGVWQWRQCDVNGNCTVKDQRTVRVVIDYAPWGLAPERGQLGINTAYCQGDLQCPEWINQLSARSNFRGGGGVEYVGKGS